MRLLDKIMPLWEQRDTNVLIRLVGRPKVIIFPVCYTTCPTHLTTATHKILLRAIEWQKQIPSAYLLISNYDVLTDLEQRFKKELLRENGVDPESVIWTDPIANSADEGRRGAQAAAKHGVMPDTLIMVTGPTHSRTAHTVAKHEFSSRIWVDCIENWRDETQPDHIVKVQRSQWKWFLINILRQFILHLPFGFAFIARRHHRIIKNIPTTV